jgi:hypothetical protein
MIIKNFKLFLEARLSDVVKVKSIIDKTDNIQKYVDMDFDSNKNLIKYITLNNRIDKRKVQFKIKWNHNISHDFKKRINDRTSFKSIEEFNEFFKSSINKVFPSMVGKQLFNNGDYCLYSKEYDISVIISFDIQKYIKGDYELFVKTILPGKTGYNIVKIIEI